ncbi:MAG: hydroxymethylglutaryl-CoA lyase, partial [Limisphaerales bacterium]
PLYEMVNFVECPRDAMQGLHDFIPTERKVTYLNLLLKAGFDTLDFGSFVSPKAIPQLADTAKVLEQLDLDSLPANKKERTKLLAIIGNTRGANDACNFEQIDLLGFPFSISNTFQQRNLNSSIQDSFDRLLDINSICQKHNKELVAYISMGFGNPYDEPWNSEIVGEWASKMADNGVKLIALADTIGVANPESISYLFSNLITQYPDVEFGAHFHTTPDTWLEKIEAAWKNGCNRFDGAMMGMGGCPMAKDDLTGNMAMENILQYFNTNDPQSTNQLDKEAVRESLRYARNLFTTYQ